MFDMPMIYEPAGGQEAEINQCIMVASEAYKIDPLLIRAIREQERGDVGSRIKNSNGTLDLGPMQINTIHMPDLEKFDITEYQVANDPCINVAVGAWHLRRKINEVGGDVWKGVAWYHSKTPAYGSRYMQKVKKLYIKLREKFFSRRGELARTGE